jgi:hypothetical protein
VDKRGQFSIIAALLVAVILIATVIATYSTIRNLPMEEQPQVLSAIDETNLALKQILGFTVGYYGSILQVTGDREYAYNLSRKYLMSGFEYIARTHPERAVSFSLKNMELQAYWFTSQSYSKGNITVQYDLTGLGIYGINYTTSCKLRVNIIGTEENKAHIRVTADENDEPLINLGKSNFKFYLYRCTNSTWAMTSPSTEPAAFSDGTYIIDIPSGVDPYSYVVQVEDQRGIVAVASSFSRYTLTLTWNSTIYSSIGGISRAVNETLINHESFETSGWPSGWTATGRWARENDRAYHGMWSADFDGPNQGASGYLTTPNLNCYGANAIYVEFWYRDEGCDSGDFLLQYYDGSAWNTAADLGANFTENQWLCYRQVITDTRYFKPNFGIRWYANLGRDEHAYVDYVTVIATKIILISDEDFSPLTVEVLQNGTIRWLGEHLQITTQAKPIPPIPVKAIHVNQTINGVDREVPFQVEDWASDYRVPLGLTSNASIFSNRNMLVFLVNPKVSKVTIWWDGSDTAKQTSYAYKNIYFTGDDVSNPDSGVLTNGLLRLTVQRASEYGVTAFRITSQIVGLSATATARFMRINAKNATYGSGTSYVIHHGIVRDIVQQEAEFSGGISSCPNVYTHIVITLPANATYYTYQLRLMFMESQKSRTVTEICPIKITTSTGSPQTENGLSSGLPIVQNGTGIFYNASTVWQHHWSQIISGADGAGIIFTDSANKMLYAFDNDTTKTGALKVETQTIELLPVTRYSVSFTYSKDVTWYGAVVTFDETTFPIYVKDGNKVTGLWMLVEYPPIITVTTES